MAVLAGLIVAAAAAGIGVAVVHESARTAARAPGPASGPGQPAGGPGQPVPVRVPGSRPAVPVSRPGEP